MRDDSEVLVYENQIEFPGDEENPEISKRLRPQITRIQNTRINIIEVLEDRLELLLTQFVAARKSWTIAKAALAIFFSILPLFVVSDFSNDFILRADVWRILYLIGLIFSGVVFVVFGMMSFANRRTRSINGCMAKIKNKAQ